MNKNNNRKNKQTKENQSSINQSSIIFRISIIIILTIMLILVLVHKSVFTKQATKMPSNFRFNIYQEINNDNEYKLFIINTTFKNNSLTRARKYSYTKKEFIDECEEEYDPLSNGWKNTLWKSKNPVASHCFNHIKTPLTKAEVKEIINNKTFQEKNICEKGNICYEVIKQ